MLPPRDSWPVGFGFRPTDEELITYYLKNKMLGNESRVRCIREINLYNYEPWELPKLSVLESDNHEWFFFLAQPTGSARGPKFKRTTRTGHWKSTGEDRKIKARGTNRVIGTRKILVFHKGRSPNGVKTNWIIHEYHLHQDNSTDLRPFVLCRLKRKSDENDVLTCDEVEPNGLVNSIIENIPGNGEASQGPLLDPQTADGDFTISKSVSSIPIDNENVFHKDTNNAYQNPGNRQSSLCPFSNNEPASMDSQAAFIFQPDQSGIPDGDFDFDKFISSLLVDDENFFHEGTQNATNAFYPIPGNRPSLHSSLFPNAESTLIDFEAANRFKPNKGGPTDDGFDICSSPRSVLVGENSFLGGPPDDINAHQA